MTMQFGILGVGVAQPRHTGGTGVSIVLTWTWLWSWGMVQTKGGAAVVGLERYAVGNLGPYHLHTHTSPSLSNRSYCKNAVST